MRPLFEQSLLRVARRRLYLATTPQPNRFGRSGSRTARIGHRAPWWALREAPLHRFGWLAQSKVARPAVQGRRLFVVLGGRTADLQNRSRYLACPNYGAFGEARPAAPPLAMRKRSAFPLPEIPYQSHPRRHPDTSGRGGADEEKKGAMGRKGRAFPQSSGRSPIKHHDRSTNLDRLGRTVDLQNRSRYDLSQRNVAGRWINNAQIPRGRFASSG
jgi:hypothetical protein